MFSLSHEPAASHSHDSPELDGMPEGGNSNGVAPTVGGMLPAPLSASTSSSAPIPLRLQRFNTLLSSPNVDLGACCVPCGSDRCIAHHANVLQMQRPSANLLGPAHHKSIARLFGRFYWYVVCVWLQRVSARVRER